MTPQPRLRLDAAIAAGLAPTGMKPAELRRACDRWFAWCLGEARNPLWLSPEAGEAYLAHLLETGSAHSAQSHFAKFQIAAGLGWGAESSAHLALTLRASRVTAKAAPADRWARASHAVARLPVLLQEPFRSLLEVSRDAPGRHGTLIWSAARIESVASVVTRFTDFAGCAGVRPVPTAALFQSWAESLAPKAAAISIAVYLTRVVDGFEKVLTPGVVYDAAAAVADRWAVLSSDEAPRKGKTARIVPASDLDRMGFDMMAEADAAPLRRITEATLYRDGLLLALAATMPERARALSALEFDRTIFLDAGGVIRFAIPGEHRKLQERRKGRAAFHASIHRPSLHRALARWRAVYRPMFDGGDWLWPSRLNQAHGLTEASLGTVIGDLTLARLGRRVSIHLVRDCVATEIIETDPVGGAARAATTLGHRDPRVTSDFYDHAEGIVASTRWQAAIRDRTGGHRESLAI